MTTQYKISVRCSFCGSENKYVAIGSTNEFGSADLDTRPPERKRSTIFTWIQRCHHCGYCASDISIPRRGLDSIVNGEEYKHQLNDSEFPELANSFICKAIIDHKLMDYTRASLSLLHAAWACDDSNHHRQAMWCRHSAADSIMMAEKNGQKIATPEAQTALLVDLLRRCGQLKQAHRLLETRRAGITHDIINRILDYQTILINNNDIACHSIQEALATCSQSAQKTRTEGKDIGGKFTQIIINEASDLMKTQKFKEALPLLQQVINNNPSDWVPWYMAGQCCRFLNDLDGAINHLTRAAQLNKDDPSLFLALGIVFQMRERWGEATDAFGRALEIDPDYDLAYNSLALTQKKIGQLEKALHNYEEGANALARRIVKKMQNRTNSQIFKYRDTPGALWLGYAIFGAMYLACSAGVDGVAMPNAEQAIEEERSEKHRGLYWVDVVTEKNQKVRSFLPNYINTFRETLRRDPSYATLIGNRGTVLEMLKRYDEADQHYSEATWFSQGS